MILRALIILLAIFAAGAAKAHDSRPLFIQIAESDDGSLRVNWKAPPSVDPRNAPVISVTACEAQTERDKAALNGGAIYRCPAGLKNAALTINYPFYNPSLSTLIRITFANGETRTAVLDPAQSVWAFPHPDSFAGVARNYFKTGVDHIIGGIDHLLFLAGLLYIARTPRRVLVTITGFTFSHSLTIFLVALNVVRVSVPAVETVIALSIIFLAAEIARNNRETLAWRRPIVVAAGFGLVHGAGFASALGEIGLPQTETISALLFFNIGVEAGQLAVIAGVFAALGAIRLAKPRLLETLNAAPARLVFSYALGIVAAVWFFERLVGAVV